MDELAMQWVLTRNQSRFTQATSQQVAEIFIRLLVPGQTINSLENVKVGVCVKVTPTLMHELRFQMHLESKMTGFVHR